MSVVSMDQEAEQAVLGACLLGGTEAVGKIVGILQPNDFYSEKHNRIYEAIRSSFLSNEPIDMTSVGAKLGVLGVLDYCGGRSYLATVYEMCPTAANIDFYAKIVHEHGTKRRAEAVGHAIVEQARTPNVTSQDIISVAQQQLIDLASDGTARGFRKIADGLGAIVDKALSRRRGELPGLSTGFPDLDTIIGGLRPAEMIVVAGRPAMGKTSLAMQIALEQVKKGTPVAVFSLEMSFDNLSNRLISTVSGVNQQRVMQATWDEREQERWLHAVGPVSEYPLFIEDSTSVSGVEMLAKARSLHAQHKLGLVVVDYLQLIRMPSGTDNRALDTADTARLLRSIARELNVPLIAVSQLNRQVEMRQDKRPMNSDLRDSGGIEEAADVISFVFRPEYYKEDDQPGVAEVIVGKNRNGPTGTAKLHFDASLTKFGSLTTSDFE